MSHIKAFTLIELLVVVSIIVILLALLVPALDKAIYQSELAVSAQKLQEIGMGATNYAVAHAKAYPHRRGVLESGWRPDQLTDHTLDDRPMLFPYIPAELHTSPLTGRPADRGVEAQITDTEGRPAWVFGSYAMFFGWKYTTEEKGMLEMEQKFTWQGQPYGVLAADFSAVNLKNQQSVSGNPDYSGYSWMTPSDGTDDFRNRPAISSMFGHVPANTRILFSAWNNDGPKEHDGVDLGYALADGAFIRYTDVKMSDPRMNLVPLHSDGRNGDWRLQLPKKPW